MIKVVEVNPPVKVSGRSAFHVYFEFNNAIVDAIKGLPAPNVWLPKLRCWELPITNIAAFLDAATFLDDIQLKLIDGEIKEISDSTTSNFLLPDWLVKFNSLH